MIDGDHRLIASVSVDLRDRQETRPSLLAILGGARADERVSEPMHEQPSGSYPDPAVTL
jgi:hypothetical protein